MAWSTPRTWSTGDVVTTARANQEIRDNLIDVGSPGIAHITMGSSQSLGTSASEVYNAINFNTLINTKNTSISGGNTLVVGVAGIWEVSCSMRFPATASASASSVRAIKLYANGSATSARDVRLNVQNVDTICQFAGYQVSLAASGTLAVLYWQNSGGSLTAQADCWFSAKLIYR